MDSEKVTKKKSKNPILSPENLDIFRELGNIGAGKAGIIIGKLIKKKIYLDIPPAQYLSISQIIEGKLIGNRKQMCLFGIIRGFFQGKIFLMTPIDDTKILLENISKANLSPKIEEYEDKKSKDFKLLSEFFNNLIQAYLEALAEFLDVSLEFEKNQFLMNLSSEFNSNLVKIKNPKQTKAITVETTIKVENEDLIRCNFLMILESKEMDQILKRIEEVW